MERFPTTKLHFKITVWKILSSALQNTQGSKEYIKFILFSSAELLKYVILDEVQQ